MVSSNLPSDPASKITGASERVSASRQNALLDGALVRRFNQDGDESAFVEIVSRYREKLYSIAFSSLRNRADAEEIVQDTFIRAHRGLAKFRGDCSLATWMHRIASNLSRNRYWYYFRRRQHATMSLDATLTDENSATLSDLLASNESGPAEEAVMNDFSEIFATHMAHLTASQRSILMQRSVDDATYLEIATVLKIKIGTVKSRIARARERLRASIADACQEWGPGSAPGDWLSPSRLSGFQTLARAA